MSGDLAACLACLAVAAAAAAWLHATWRHIDTATTLPPPAPFEEYL